MTKKFFLTTVLIIVALIIVGFFYYSHSAYIQTAEDEDSVRSLARIFGSYLNSVSLTGDTETVKRDIQQVYGPYVTDTLLQQWRADPSKAPGRLVSSPWPDGIGVKQVIAQGEGYVVNGNVTYMTSADLSRGGNAGLVPVVMQMQKVNGTWIISAYQEERVGAQ